MPGPAVSDALLATKLSVPRGPKAAVLRHRLLDRLDAGMQGPVTLVAASAGAGKSALLSYLSHRIAGWRVATAVGVESEMELAYSGLHQLCGPMLDHLDRLPVPQREALATVFGLGVGPAPDRFLVGLATLSLLADAAEQQPSCVRLPKTPDVQLR